jgi:hypothetical protein
LLAGIVLAGGRLDAARTPLILLALSLFYVAGMYLNDAFDRDFDRDFRPERPIPSGHATAATVFAAGFCDDGGRARSTDDYRRRRLERRCGGGGACCRDRRLRRLALGKSGKPAVDGGLPHAGPCCCRQCGHWRCT